MLAPCVMEMADEQREGLGHAIVYLARTNPTGAFKNNRRLVATQMHCEAAMTSDRTILITGVTGNQGGAVAQALKGAGFHLRGLTRAPDGERAAAVARHGGEGVKGD